MLSYFIYQHCLVGGIFKDGNMQRAFFDLLQYYHVYCKGFEHHRWYEGNLLFDEIEWETY